MLIGKRKYNVGRHGVDLWIFGGICPEQNNRAFLQIVEARDRDTLFPIIQTCIAPGSHIISDGWAAYRRIPRIPLHPPYTHDTVNHSQNFVDPVTGVHTQSIESYWNRMKIKLKSMLGCKRSVLDSYLDEFMWLELYGKEGGIKTMDNILTHMADWFNPN